MTESKKTGFAKNVFFSYSNKMITLVVSFIYTLLIANFLGPEKYGLVTYFMALISGLVGAVGFNFLISTLSNFFPKTKSKKLFKLVLGITVFLSVASFLVLLIFAQQILSMLGKDNLLLMQLSSALILLLPLYSLATALFQGFKRFGSVLKVVAIESIINLIFAVLAVIYLGFDFYGVLFAKLISLVIALIVFLIYYRKLVFSRIPIDKKDLARYISTAFPFSLVRGWEEQAFTIMLGLFISNISLGFYYMAQKLASIAISTPINSLSNVLLPYSLEKSKDIKTLSNYASINIKLALILSIFLSIILLIIGWPFLLILFPEYLASYWLLPFLCVTFILSSLTILHNVYTAVNRLEFPAIAGVFSIIATIVSGWFLMPAYGIYGAVTTQIIMAVVYMFLLWKFLEKVNARVEIIPRMHDLTYFYSLFRQQLIKKFIK